MNISSINENISIEEDNKLYDENIIFKNKVDIEKELFDEFNGTIQYSVSFEENKNEPLKEETEDNSKFPDISIDEYMKNFDENSVKEQEVSSLFNDDDVFPTIPM